MTRTIPADRLEHLVQCATTVFIDSGYRRTQMADVAAALGVAKGTLYLYVESKEALFDLAARYADSAPPEDLALPIRTPKASETLRYVRERLASNRAPAALLAALERRRPANTRAELAAI